MAEETAAAGKSVLVVDDDPMVLNYLSRVIARFGYPVISASSAAEALVALAADGNIGFVLTDIDMPEMTGIELHSKIVKHELWSTIPVALMTGGVGNGIPKGVLVLLKPFDPLQIRCTMAAHLGGICPSRRVRTSADGHHTHRLHLAPLSGGAPNYCTDHCEKCPKRCCS